MRTPGTKGLILLVCVGAALGAFVAVASAASQVVTPTVICCEFSAPDFTVDAGTVATFQNDTPDVHNIQASGKGPDGKPLFSVKQISSASAPINGTQYLAPGDYRFVCTIHGGMNSTLTVLPGAAPVARPSVAIQVPSQKLGTVASSGKLTVTVRGKAAATGVSLVVTKGKARLGSLQKLNLSGGAKRTLKVPLTAVGRKSLKNLTSATLAAEATVPYGKPARASRTLY